MDARLLAFAGVATLLVITPGPDFALVTRNGLRHGRKAGVLTALGVNAGLVLWASAAALGIAAVLRASATAFTVVKIVGAAYLVYLGVVTLLDSRRAPQPSGAQPATSRQLGGAAAFRQGLLGNALNPKAAVIYTLILPQFVAPGPGAEEQLVALSLLFSGIAHAWYLSYALLLDAAGSWLRRPRQQRLVERATGTVLAGLGLRLALERP